MPDHTHKWMSLSSIGKNIEIVKEGRGRSVYVITEICVVDGCYIGRTGNDEEFDVRPGIEHVEGGRITTQRLGGSSKESE
jgi:hypothetical protein